MVGILMFLVRECFSEWMVAALTLEDNRARLAPNQVTEDIIVSADDTTSNCSSFGCSGGTRKERTLQE